MPNMAVTVTERQRRPLPATMEAPWRPCLEAEAQIDSPSGTFRAAVGPTPARQGGSIPARATLSSASNRTGYCSAQGPSRRIASSPL
jgi:hypothetical protein